MPVMADEEAIVAVAKAFYDGHDYVAVEFFRVPSPKFAVLEERFFLFKEPERVRLFITSSTADKEFNKLV